MRAALLAVVAAGAVASAAPLSKDHEKLACAGCHVRGDDVDDGACVGCHPAVARRSGLHAAVVTPSERCESCHGEHQGRAFDLRGWSSLPPGEPGFDHVQFASPIGGHDAYECAACHDHVDAQGLRTYLGLEALVDADGNLDCQGCHTHRGVHDGKWSNAQCDGCHIASQRRRAGLVARNHGAATAFPLVNGHRGVACTACHGGVRTGTTTPRFDHLDPSCGAAGCHEDTQHDGRLGPRCTDCHVSGTWVPIRDDAPGRPSPPQRCRGCHASVER